MFIEIPKNEKEFRDSAIKIMTLNIATNDLIYAYDNKESLLLSIDKNGTIEYETIYVDDEDLPDGDYLELFDNDSIFCVFGMIVESGIDEDYGEFQEIKIPNFYRQKFINLYQDTTNQNHIVGPYSTKNKYFIEEDWESISKRFSCWGKYLAYCRNSIEREEERERQRWLNPIVEEESKYWCDDDGEVHIKPHYALDDEYLDEYLEEIELVNN